MVSALVAVAGTVRLSVGRGRSPDLELRPGNSCPPSADRHVAFAWLVVPIALVAHRVVQRSAGGRQQRFVQRSCRAPGPLQLLLALLVLTAGSTFLVLRVYLTAAARSWGDSFLWISLAVFAVVGVQLLVLGVAGVVAGSRRSFHGGMVAGVVTLVAFTAGYLAVYLPERTPIARIPVRTLRLNLGPSTSFSR